jgi:predicted GNAT family acetyltransferase
MGSAAAAEDPPQPETRVERNDDERRYEAYVGEARAGVLTFRVIAGRVVLVHTEVDEAFAGRGIAGRLAAGALDDIRARGLRARALCPFVAAYVERHPAYADLIVEDPRPSERAPDG